MTPGNCIECDSIIWEQVTVDALMRDSQSKDSPFLVTREGKGFIRSKGMDVKGVA